MTNSYPTSPHLELRRDPPISEPLSSPEASQIGLGWDDLISSTPNRLRVASPEKWAISILVYSTPTHSMIKRQAESSL
jgi:hypothetical protein